MKNKTYKEILLCPEFKHLAFELIRNEYLDKDFLSEEEKIENKIELFIERKLKQLKMQGV